MSRVLRAVGAALALLVLVLAGGVALAPSAAAIPGIPDCKEAPTPEVPGRGVVGFFESAPTKLPAPGDPFAAKPTTTIHEQYGYAGLRFNTYDLGCGPDLARSPDASIGTSVANWIYTFPKTMVAATGAVVGAAFHPEFLGVFDPLVEQVVQTLRTTVFEQWVILSIAAVGLLLLWKARHASLASSTAAVGWALLVLVLATMVFRWPLVAGDAADKTVTTTLGAVASGLNGEAPGASDDAAEASIAGMQSALLYQSWLGGTFGDANSDVAKKYGPDIFDSQALTWREAQVLKDDPARGRQIIEQKQKRFESTASRIKAEDPDAYEYLTGKRSDTRVGYAMLAGFATLCAVPFLLIAGLLVLGALIIVRFGIMLFPAFATLGLFPPMRSLVVGVGNTMAAALINAVVFGIGAAVAVKGIGVLLAPSTALPPWLDVVLVLLLTVVMWVALRPFRRLSMMVSRNRNHFGAATGAAGDVSRGAARTGGRILTTALGTFLGVAAANKATDERELRTADGVPQRAEAITSYGEAEGAPVAAPIQITAGSVTVSSPPEGAGSTAGAAAVGAGAGYALGSGGGSPGTASRVEGGASAGRVPPDTPARGIARPDRTPALSSGSNGSGGSNGSNGSGGARGSADGGRQPRGDGGRFEAGGGAGSGRRTAATGGDRSRANPVDLSDYDFDELADIFRPEPTRPPRSPRPGRTPVRSEGAREQQTPAVEAGRGR